MRSSLLLSAPFLADAILASPIRERSISADLLNNFVRFTQYSSAAYQTTCPSPLGNILVEQFSDGTTNTQGFIARDDTRQEIIVSFRGSFQLQDFDTDVDIVLIPFESAGVSAVPSGALTHTGFMTAYNSVASIIISTVQEQLTEYSGYTIISTGHSLGGALASIGALSLKSNFPNSDVLMYSFGQPRTGNAVYASMVDNIVGDSNSFRAVHTVDGVPTIIPQDLGYQHHGTEFWNFVDPATAENVKQCTGDEDPTCSDSIPTTGINAAHIVYFGQLMALDPTLC